MSKQSLYLTITLCAFWLLLSGYLDKINLLILGVLSVALVVLFSARMKIHDYKNQPLRLPLISLLRYWCWLFNEILKSNMSVARLIINPKMPIKPSLKMVPSNLNTDIGRVIYANSITLTPGTVALNVSSTNGIIVHALHQDSITELEDGVMHKHVISLEKRIFANSFYDKTSESL